MPNKINPRYEPKNWEQAVGYLVEEAGEVLAAAGKTIRWGQHSFNPELPDEQRITNITWLRRELVDLERSIAYVREHGDIGEDMDAGPVPAAEPGKPPGGGALSPPRQKGRHEHVGR